MMAFGHGSGTNQIIQLLRASSRAADANRHQLKLAALHFFSLVRNLAPMRSGCTVAIRAESRTLNASTASSGKAASARLEGSGEECRMAEAAKNLFVSVLTCGTRTRGPAVVIGLGHSLRLGGS
jgi:hypothetical protein